MPNPEYLIVGQGIAGSMLAYALLERGKKVVVADPGTENASCVAAGIFNPVTGRRFVPTWKGDVLFPFLRQTYRALEGKLATSFLHEMPIEKYFNDLREQNEWTLRSHAGHTLFRSSGYAQPCLELPPWGSLEIHGGGYIDTHLLLSRLRTYLTGHGALLPETIDYAELERVGTSVRWKGLSFRKVIFCEGSALVNNPWFGWLPLVPAKGELLTVEAPALRLDRIVHKGIFILPLGNGRFRVGSTNTWQFVDPQPSRSAKEELCSKLEQLLKCPFRVIAHQAGIRPAMRDRRPVLGLHPEIKQFGILNGLGTKGFSLAPYFAFQMAAFLDEETDVDKEADISRFMTFFRNSSLQ